MSVLRWRPCTPDIGAVVDRDLAGLVDGGAGPGDTIVDAIHETWLARHVLVFPDQALTPAHQEVVAGWFGPLERSTPQRAQRGEEMPGPVHHISNRVPGGQAGHGELVFHSDSATRRHPIRAVSLYAQAVPADGGHTVFADAMSGWRTLPQALRDRVAPLEARHAFDYDTEAKPVSADFAGFQAVHPVVMDHPLTGEPVLYVNRGQTWRIEGLDDTTSAALLDALWAHLEAPERCYEHVWQLGDLVIWDNVALQHARTAFDPSEERTLRRVVVSGAPDGDRAFVA
jgi:alpha-ketoglutarate-dependent taurine dioxygenase